MNVLRRKTSPLTHYRTIESSYQDLAVGIKLEVWSPFNVAEVRVCDHIAYCVCVICVCRNDSRLQVIPDRRPDRWRVTTCFHVGSAGHRASSACKSTNMIWDHSRTKPVSIG